MRISLTSSGRIATAYKKVNLDANIYSFRSMTIKEMRYVIKNTDTLIHTAAPNREARYDEHAGAYGLTKIIIGIIRKHNKHIHLINIGSMSYLDKDGCMPLCGMESYAYWKHLSEVSCLTMIPNVVSVRMSSIFYKEDGVDILSTLASSALRGSVNILNKGEATRDYIPINIVARYLDYIVKNKTDRTVNICSGYKTSFLDVVNMLKEMVDFNVEYIVGKTPYVLSEFTRTLPEIKFSLKDEIEEYIKT